MGGAEGNYSVDLRHVWAQASLRGHAQAGDFTSCDDVCMMLDSGYRDIGAYEYARAREKPTRTWGNPRPRPVPKVLIAVLIRAAVGTSF